MDTTKFFDGFPRLHGNDPQDELTLTTSVHCELTLVLRSMGSPVYPVTIGLSKHCYRLCQKFIKAFQARHNKEFFVSGFQGTIQSGWLLPPRTSAEIQTDLLEDELDELRATIEAGGVVLMTG